MKKNTADAICLAGLAGIGGYMGYMWAGLLAVSTPVSVVCGALAFVGLVAGAVEESEKRGD